MDASPDSELTSYLKIFSHLEPIDLLHLTRVAKAFRSFLLGKQTVGIWASARRNVDDLPECPPFLSEPAYAHLMFSPYCHVSFSLQAPAQPDHYTDFLTELPCWQRPECNFHI